MPVKSEFCLRQERLNRLLNRKESAEKKIESRDKGINSAARSLKGKKNRTQNKVEGNGSR